MPNLPVPAERRPVTAHPALVRAALSPTAIAATAVGAGIGVADHSLPVAIVLAVVGWSGRMVAAMVARRRRERAALPRPAPLDPWSVPEPWRALVQQAASSQTRFDQVLDTWPPGPLSDRVRGLRPAFYREFAAVGTIAAHGAALGGWTGAPLPAGGPSQQALAEELERTRVERVALGERADGRGAELSRREEAIASQIRAAHAARQASESVHDRLRTIVARLDESVTHLYTLSVEAGDGGGIDSVSSVLLDLDDQLESLRAGVAEARTPPDALKP